jgi:phytanoyl-CoA hydroxylase
VPGSHPRGWASVEGGTITAEQFDVAGAAGVALPAAAGESILVHNHLWHRTSRNTTAAPRRAVSISYLDAETRCGRKRRAPRRFLSVFGG